VFGELYGSTVEYRFARDVLDVPLWTEGGPEPRTIVEANFAPERLLSLRTRGSAAYKGIYVMLLKQGAKDFRTNASSTLQNYFEEAVDIHHVFPKNWCGQNDVDEKRRESIVNKTPLTARTNRIIGGDAPSDYLRILQERHGASQAGLDDNLRSHFIEPALLYADDFDSYFESRQTALLAQIGGLMGKQLISNPGDAMYVGDDQDID
jgi:hypothetical protein